MPTQNTASIRIRQRSVVPHFLASMQHEYLVYPSLGLRQASNRKGTTQISLSRAPSSRWIVLVTPYNILE